MSFTKPELKHIKSKVASSNVSSSASKAGFSTTKSSPAPKVFKGKKGKTY